MSPTDTPTDRLPPDPVLDWLVEPPAFVYLLGTALAVLGPLVAALLLAT